MNVDDKDAAMISLVGEFFSCWIRGSSNPQVENSTPPPIHRNNADGSTDDETKGMFVPSDKDIKRGSYTS